MEKTSKTKIRESKFFEPECPVTSPVYQWKVTPEGYHVRVIAGEKNFDDEIQLFKDSCDIKILVDRLKNGDAATIDQLSQPMAFGDVNQFPEEYHPQAGRDALIQFWEAQPDAVKQKYGGNFKNFEKFFLNLTDAVVSQMISDEEAAKKAAEEAAKQKEEKGDNE